METVTVLTTIAVVIAIIIGIAIARRGVSAPKMTMPDFKSDTSKWLVGGAVVIGAMVVAWITIPFENVFWLMVLVVLIAISFKLPKPWGYGTTLLALLLVAVFFAGGFNSLLTTLDRRINHGDWSVSADYIRSVVNGSVVISRGGYDRFEANGKVTLKNAWRQQCMDVHPDADHVAERLPDGWVVKEPISNEVIYTMTWSRDGWEYYVVLPPGRTETLTVTTVPIGEAGCSRPVSV